MITIEFETVTGLTFGIEHCTGDPDEFDFFEWIVPIHLGIFRIFIIKHRTE